MSLPLILAILLLVGVFLWLRQRSGSPGRYGGSSSRSAKSQSRVNGATRRQLLRMVGGNRAVAGRLVSTVQENYPGKSEQWCWEKAIYDIQRDRRS